MPCLCLLSYHPSYHPSCHLCCPSQPPNDLNLNLNLLIYSFSCSFEDGDDDMIEILIKKDFNIEGGHVKGDCLVIDASPSYTVGMLKAIIRTMWPVPVSQQRLKLKNRHK